MKYLGYEINGDGIVHWRLNGGLLERYFFYALHPSWESVQVNNPRGFDLEGYCRMAGYCFAKDIYQATKIKERCLYEKNN